MTNTLCIEQILPPLLGAIHASGCLVKTVVANPAPDQASFELVTVAAVFSIGLVFRPDPDFERGRRNRRRRSQLHQIR